MEVRPLVNDVLQGRPSVSKEELVSRLSGVQDLTVDEEVLDAAGVTGSSVLDVNGVETVLQVAALKTAFVQLDQDGTGDVSVAEIGALLVSLGLCPEERAEAVASGMMTAVDRDDDGKVSFSEFARAFRGCQGLKAIASEWLAMAGIDTGSDLVTLPAPPGVPLSTFLIAGGLGGVVSRTLTAPLERVKLVLQTSNHPSSMTATFKDIVAKEGLAGLWRGNLVASLRVFPFAGLVCVTYSQAVKVLPSDDELDAMEPVWRSIAGAAAGCVAATATHPLDLVRVRLATSQSGSSFSSIVSGLLRDGGVRSLWRGLSPTLFAIAPFVAIQQASYDVVKSSVLQYSSLTPSVPLFLGCGAIAGLAAQAVTFPLDVLRRRAQTMNRPADASVVGHFSWLRSFVQPSGGVRSLYQGFTPTLLKCMPAVAASVLVRDAVLGRLD